MKSVTEHPYLHIPGLPYPKPVAQWTHDEALANFAFMESSFQRYMKTCAHDADRVALARRGLSQIDALRAQVEARMDEERVH